MTEHKLRLLTNVSLPDSHIGYIYFNSPTHQVKIISLLTKPNMNGQTTMINTKWIMVVWILFQHKITYKKSDHLTPPDTKQSSLADDGFVVIYGCCHCPRRVNLTGCRCCYSGHCRWHRYRWQHHCHYSIVCHLRHCLPSGFFGSWRTTRSRWSAYPRCWHGVGTSPLRGAQVAWAMDKRGCRWIGRRWTSGEDGGLSAPLGWWRM